MTIDTAILEEIDPAAAGAEDSAPVDHRCEAPSAAGVVAGPESSDDAVDARENAAACHAAGGVLLPDLALLAMQDAARDDDARAGDDREDDEPDGDRPEPGLVDAVEHRLAERGGGTIRIGQFDLPAAAVSFAVALLLHAAIVAAGVFLWFARPVVPARIVSTDGNGGVEGATPGDNGTHSGEVAGLTSAPPQLTFGANAGDEPTPEFHPDALSDPPPPPATAPPPVQPEIEPTPVPAPIEPPVPNLLAIGPMPAMKSVPPTPPAAPEGAGAPTSPSDSAQTAADSTAGESSSRNPGDATGQASGGSSGAPRGVAAADGPDTAGVFIPATAIGGTGAGGGRGGGLGGDGLPIPIYPEISRRRGEEGTVVLEGEIRPDGTLAQVRVVQDPGYPRLVRSAIDCFETYRFAPATQNGQPVAGKVTKAFRFVLRG